MAQQPESLARRLLRSAAHFSAGQTIAMVASIARISVSARYLSKEANGTWLAMQLILSYGAHLHFGSVFGIFRSIPILRAQGKAEAALEEQQTAFGFLLLVSTVSAPALYVATARTLPGAPGRYVLETIALVVLTLFRGYWNTIFKAHSRFQELARGMTWGAIASFLTTGLVIPLGLDGLAISTAAQAVVEMLYLGVKAPPPAPRLSLNLLKGQIRVGFMTLLTSVGFLLVTTIDRTVMIERLGADAAGAHYLGANIMVLMPVLAGMPAAVLTPQFFDRVGRGESVRPLVARPVELASLAFAGLIAVASVTISPAIHLVWPKLVTGIPAAHAALFATYPLVLAGLMGNVYYAHDRQGLHVIVLLLSALVGFGFAHIGASLTHDITGPAVGAALGLYFYFPASAFASFSLLTTPSDGLKLAASAMVPIVYAGVVAAGVEYALARALPTHIVAQGVLGVLLVAVLVAPLAVRARTLLRRGLSQAS